MRKTAQFVLPMILALATSASAQDNGARSAAATRAAAPAATTTPAPTQPAPANAGQSTITGVPRYRAGFRGPRGTTAPAATGSISITGKGDHTGTGGGVGLGPAALNVPRLTNPLGIASGTPIRVRLNQAVDSGHAHNGDTVQGVLAAPLGTAPAGAPVQLTVVAAAAAGTMTSQGELSLQVISINNQAVLSNVVTAVGEEGKVLLPDDAPTRGTEAIFTPDKPIDLPAA